MTNAKPMASEVLPGDSIPQDELTGHSYDGIQEFDNPLPGWWKWLFVATVAIAPPYWAFYHFGNENRTLAAQYDFASAENARLQFAEMGELNGDEATLVKHMNLKGSLNIGKGIFQTNCASCHKADGSGLVGPNLTDDHYKNVKQITDLYTVVANGAAGGAMPAWKTRLSNNEIVMVAAYAASLRGLPAASGRQPEGNVIPPWPSLAEIIAPEAVAPATDDGAAKP